MRRAGAGAESLGGLAGWLLGKVRGSKAERPRLALIDRMTLGPKQSLALVEAEGRRILVATSAEGGPAFYPLDAGAGVMAGGTQRSSARGQARVSW